MNNVRLVFLAVILGVVSLFVGCQSGLSDEKVKKIVEEEVARQLTIGHELKTSKLSIENEDGEIVAVLSSLNGEGFLTISNADGKIVAGLGSQNGEGSMIVGNTNGKIAAFLSSVNGEGFLKIGNADGKMVAFFSSQNGEGLLNTSSFAITNADGKVVTSLGSLNGNGVLFLLNKNGQVTFKAP
ncbi:MAG: hypothetical protein Q8O43_05590 [Dehalococcoidia bacterium]|nr:hypothetical protein [Dehalococcoidia bacterium]